MRKAVFFLIGAVLILDIWFIALMNRTQPAPLGQDTSAYSPAAPDAQHPARPPQRPAANLPTGNELIRGRIEDRFGAPVAGATVDLHARDLDPARALESYSKAPQWQTHSDAAGLFLFGELPAGTYVIRSIHEELHAVAAVILEDGGAVAEPILTMHPARRASGILLDEKNEPISGAWAYAASRAGEAGAASLYRLFPSAVNGEGRFSLPLLAMDTWNVLAVVRGRSAILSAPVAPEDGTFTMVATPGAAVRGRVVLPDGTPAKRVAVEALESTLGLERIRMATDLYGVFTWPDLRPASYALGIDSYRYVLADATASFVVSPADAAAQAADAEALPLDLGVIPLRDATLLRGQVTDADTGLGVAGVELQLLETLAPPSRSDASGFYRLGPVVTGAYTVALRRPRGYAVLGSATQAVSISDGVVVAAPDFQLRRGVRLWGRVLDAGNTPVADANVFVSYDGSMTKHAGSRTKSDGTFLLGGFWHDAGIRVWAERMDEGSVGAGPIDVGEEDVLGITLTLAAPRRGRLEGRVLQGEGGAVGGAIVHCVTPDPSIQGPLVTRCDAEGGFAFDNLLPGTYHLDAATPDGRASAEAVPVTTEGMGATRGIALTVR